MRDDVLRLNQQSLTGKIRLAFKTCRSVLAVASTGFGKTVCFAFIADNAAKLGNSVFIFVHRKELIRQTSRALKKFGIEHGIIASGYPITDTPIQICSIQTFVRWMHKFQRPDLMIIDECHFAISAMYEKVMQWADEDPNSHRLGVTATPARRDGKGFTKYFETFVEADNIRTLIADGWLVEPTIYSPPLRDEDENDLDLSSSKMTKDGDFDQDFDALLIDRRVITGSAIEHYKRMFPHNPKTVVFCGTVQHAHNCAAQFNENGIPSAAIDGSMDEEERTKILSDLEEGRISCMMSCNLVSEGFDLPAIEVAIMLRRIGPKCISLFIQQVGRILRPCPGKSQAFLLDHVENTKRHIKAVLSFFSEEHRIDWRPYFEGRQKKSRASEELGELETCPKCFMTLPVAVMKPICPNCGHNFKVKGVGGGAMELEEVDGELVKFEAEKMLTFRATTGSGRPKQVIKKLERA